MDQQKLEKLEYYLSDLSIQERVQLMYTAVEDIKSGKIDAEFDPEELANSIRRFPIETKHLTERTKTMTVGRGIFRGLLASTGVFILFLAIGAGYLISTYTPLIKIDESKGHVLILGGLVEIDGQLGQLKVGNQYDFSQSSYTNEFSVSLNEQDLHDELILNFNAGSFNFVNSDTKDFELKCKLEKVPDQNVVEQDKDTTTIDFSNMKGGSCDVFVPEDIKLSINAKAAKIDISRPLYNVYIELDAGNVSISPDAESDYNYRLSVEQGHIGHFKSSDSPNAYEINIEMKNGSISNH